MMDKRQRLLSLIEQPGIVIVPGAYDALTARLVEKAGFAAVFATGAGIANTCLGLADLGLLTFDELLRTVTQMCIVTNIPLIVDADTGFGGFLNVQRTVRELERAGAAAITLEDQEFPKRCGHFTGKKVVSTGEMIARLSAALDARVDKRFLIIARTDARACEGLEAAIERMHRYFSAGADVGFIEAPRTIEEVRAIGEAFRGKPLLINLVEGGQTPLLSATELEQMGYKFIICANTVLRAAIKNIMQVLKVLKEEGSQVHLQDLICTWEERQALVEANHLMNLEDHYGKIAISSVSHG